MKLHSIVFRKILTLYFPLCHRIPHLLKIIVIPFDCHQNSCCNSECECHIQAQKVSEVIKRRCFDTIPSEICSVGGIVGQHPLINLCLLFWAELGFVLLCCHVTLPPFDTSANPHRIPSQSRPSPNSSLTFSCPIIE